jgi:DNA-binding MarR family transcriptional regulator
VSPSTNLRDVTDAELLDAALCEFRELTLAGHEFRRRFAAFAKVGVVDTIALSHLRAAGPLTAGELADRVGLAPSGITALTDRLERAGLARRVTRPTNRRSVDIELTEMGRQTLDAGDAWIRDALESSADGRLAELVQTLRNLQRALRDSTRSFVDAAPKPPAR